jgi:hypothetical protein
MSTAAVAALVVTAVLVAALAFYLTWVLVILHRLVDTLGKVSFGVGAIAHRLEPLGPVIADIDRDLSQVADAAERVAADLDPGKGAAAS